MKVEWREDVEEEDRMGNWIWESERVKWKRRGRAKQNGEGSGWLGKDCS